jgi:D-glycero-D-manno-heptose 1,7-bisphosphate phosphatase
MRSRENPPIPRRAVFLDRDGVLIADVDHLVALDQVRVLPRVPEALARLRAAGWRLIIATNQSVVARGWITEEQLREVHRVLLADLRSEGAEIDGVYYCPHHPEGSVAAYRRACLCRKPSPGMLLQAAEEWHLDMAECVIVGDASSDVEAGRCAGCHTVLIRSAGDAWGDRGAADPDHVARDLPDAAEWILAHLGKT